MKWNRGQSMFEIIVALGIFALLVVALAQLSAGGYTGFLRGGEYTQAQSLVSEAVEVLRSVREGAWNEIVGTNIVVTLSGGAWQVTSGASELVDNKYTRKIELADVCRDSSGAIVSCPPTGTNYKDPYAKQANISVSWGLGNTATTSLLLTNWDSKDWTQTDWKDGGGQVIWSDPEKYDSRSGVDDSTPGQVSLMPAGAGIGGLVARASGGVGFGDTTNADFSSATLSDVVIENTGSAAQVVLDKTLQWVPDPVSRVVTTNNINAIAIISTTNVWAVGNGGIILHYDGTSWQSVASPVTRSLNGIAFGSPTIGYAVGDRGTILKYDGSAWIDLTSAISPGLGLSAVDLNSVDMESPTSAMVAGSSGRAVWWNGVQWFANSGGATVIFNGAADTSQSDWFVGNNGTVWRFLPGHGSFTVVGVLGQVGADPSSIIDVMEVDGVNDANVWAVGKSGFIGRFSSSDNKFLGVNVPAAIAGKTLNDIDMLSSTDGWVVGNDGTIMHYDGASWTQSLSPTPLHIQDVSMVSATEGWAVGERGLILHYFFTYKNSGVIESRVFDSGVANTSWNIVPWTQIAPGGTTVAIKTRTGNTPTPDASWSSYTSSGTNPASPDITSPPGRYIQYQATLTRPLAVNLTPTLQDLTLITNIPTTNPIRAVVSINANDAWAVANGGRVFHYEGAPVNGGSAPWTEYLPKPSTRDLNEIFALSSSDIWVVGNTGTILHYDGAAWSTITSPVGSHINDIFMLSATEGWAVGVNGKILKYDGINWVLNTTLPGDLNSVYALSSSQVWVVGDTGKIYFYNGSTWALVSTNPNTSSGFNDIFMISPTSGWVVGNSGKIYFYNGSTWTQVVVSAVGNETLSGVTFSGPNAGWIVTGNGKIFFYDGSSWVQIQSPSTKSLYDVSVHAPRSGWIVGNSGTIIEIAGTYTTSGSFVSSAFNMTDNSPAQIVEWDQDIPNNCVPATCAIRLQIATAPDASGAPGAWSEWVGPEGLDGDETDYFTSSKGELISAALNGKRWVRYRVFLDGDAQQNYTPILKEVRVNYK